MKSNMTVALVRGAYAHPCELQGYVPLSRAIPLTVCTSQSTLGTIPLPRKSFRSPSDIGNRYTSAITRRLIGSQYLVGLEKYLSTFSVVHTADPFYAYSYQAARVLKPLIATYWETQPFRNETIAIMKKHKYYVLQRATFIHCYTQRSCEAVQKEGVEHTRIRHIYPAIDTRHFPPRHRRPEKKFLYVGRLVPEKGVLVLLESFHMIRKEYPDATLTIVGTGPLEKECRQQKNVQVLNAAYDTMASLYHAHTCCIVPSYATDTWEEQVGYVLLEAMATATPLIACRSGAIPEIAGPAAEYAIPRNSRSLYTAIKRSITQPDVFQKRATIGETRVQTVFSLSRFTNAMYSLYEEAYRHHIGA